MLAEMSQRQFLEWMEYYALEPFGARQEDLRAGILGSILINGNPHRRSSARTVKPQDLFPSLKDTALKVQSYEEMIDAAKRFAMCYQGQVAIPDLPAGVRIMNEPRLRNG
jgi:hypothetical protein